MHVSTCFAALHVLYALQSAGCIRETLCVNNGINGCVHAMATPYQCFHPALTGADCMHAH